MNKTSIHHNEASRKAIDDFIMTARQWRNIPERFVTDLETWADQWPQDIESSTPAHPDDHRYWIPVRPYSISEPAKQPGMPGRTSLHHLINDLPIPPTQRKNRTGKLTPKAVRLIMEYLERPKGALKNES